MQEKEWIMPETPENGSKDKSSPALSFSLVIPTLDLLLRLLSLLSLYFQGRKAVLRRIHHFASGMEELRLSQPRWWYESYALAFCLFSAVTLFWLPECYSERGELAGGLPGLLLGVGIPLYRLVEITVVVASIVFGTHHKLNEEGGLLYIPVGNARSWALMTLVMYVNAALCFATLNLTQGATWQPKITDSPTALYHTLVTITTLGYGDIHPTSEAAKWLVMAQLLYFMLFAFLVFPIALTAFRTKESHTKNEQPSGPSSAD
jgi:hypothetical protein